MARTSSAIAGAETGHRRGKFIQDFNERAFVTSGEDPGAKRSPGNRQPVDMPAHQLVLAKVPRNAGADTARAIRASAIQVLAWSELHIRPLRQRDADRRDNRDQQDIGAAITWKRFNINVEAGNARPPTPASSAVNPLRLWRNGGTIHRHCLLPIAAANGRLLLTCFAGIRMQYRPRFPA